MQKVLQITAQAQRQAARRAAKKKLEIEKAERWAKGRPQLEYARGIRDTIKQARKRRVEDWELGPLAPRRDFGPNAALYGALPAGEFHPPPLYKDDRPKWMSITEGDRVAVIQGPDRGKIGTVRNVQLESAAVVITDINVADAILGDWVLEDLDEPTGKLSTMPRAIPVEHCRLVFPLPDPKTGIPKDTVIDRLEPINLPEYPKGELSEGDRVIPGTNIIIPWPARVEPDYEIHEADTERIWVDEETFRPFLLYPPMPISVIDELRNKYSKFRTRHDHAFIEKLKAIDAKEERRKGLIKTMRMPREELADLRKAKKEATAVRKLTEEQLEMIGRVIVDESKKSGRPIRKPPSRETSPPALVEN